jgi:hypothetical protein
MNPRPPVNGHLEETEGIFLAEETKDMLLAPLGCSGEFALVRSIVTGVQVRVRSTVAHC